MILKRRRGVAALAWLALVIIVGIIVIVILFPEVAEWIQENLRIIFD